MLSDWRLSCVIAVDGSRAACSQSIRWAEVDLSTTNPPLNNHMAHSDLMMKIYDTRPLPFPAKGNISIRNGIQEGALEGEHD